MDVLDMALPVERLLCEKATRLESPIGATFELTPLCNMDCKMCYVRMSPEELRRKGRIRTADEWLETARQAKAAGLLFLLLTGGEPFLYPEFRRLYEGLKAMGLFVSINTNGTLLDRETVGWLAKNPPRKLNITLYGASDETYGRLCGNPHGFTQVVRALDLCEEFGIQVKINYTVTRENADDARQILQLIRDRRLESTVAYYVFPANRKEKTDNSASRLPPEEAARVRILSEVARLGMQTFINQGRALLMIEDGTATTDKPPHDTAFTCRAGKSTYWINWQGRMLLCGMTDNMQFDLDELGFERCWAALKQAVRATSCSEKCAGCPHETFCARCAASAIAETGTFEGTPAYLCRLYDCYIGQIRELVGALETAGKMDS
ncbi:MAG: radical SAM protein [Candidatus Ventricola sp.]|nr:radical SAM protein [Candidatus Ventricola sp.]